ncbi:MAG TPA: autorepressor SdpR family transcription factor [Vicinamibacterales bacterium]|nr:autorepressor SdpR family transcription factor [Vicinamibacterales bacterium]
MKGRPAAGHAAFAALADQTRRDILNLLRDGPRTSGQIADAFHSSWPTISRHLGVLRHAGLVVAERQGQEIYYELNTSVFQDVVRHLMELMTPAARTGPTRARRRRSRQEA